MFCGVLGARGTVHCFVVPFLLLVGAASAHQAISYPPPISRDIACRISNKQNCPGPCPTRDLRKDQTPNNPSITVERNGWISVNTMANNHRGGFSRWTLVHVRDMYSKKMHKKNAFLWTCADLSVTKCTKRNHDRDCFYDNAGVYYRHSIQIPPIYQDGVYVLGWAWYGGGERWGDFGDYYDCMYIHVRGGPYWPEYQPTFWAGPSLSGRNGMCRSTVNRLGICWREPCPDGGRWTSLQKPAEFSNGMPRRLPASRFTNPWKPKPRKFNSPYVTSLTIRSADYPARVLTSSLLTRNAHVFITKKMRPTVTCEVSGSVQYVTFYVNGRSGRTDYQAPYSIAGDFYDKRRGRWRYAPWKHDMNDNVMTLACKAVGWDGTEHTANLELSTAF
ncbi:unnamed protein product [Agarophyton chilense]